MGGVYGEWKMNIKTKEDDKWKEEKKREKEYSRDGRTSYEKMLGIYPKFDSKNNT
jgi:hypothetical protein